MTLTSIESPTPAGSVGCPLGPSTGPATEVHLSDRVLRLHQEVLRTPPALCAERALLVTRYFRRPETRPPRPMILRKAEALAHVLREKTVRIYPDELLVGCFTSHRVGGGIYPELHGVAMLEDLFQFGRRKVNPLRVAAKDRAALLYEVMPFWVSRFMVMRSMSLPRALRFVVDQLSATSYLINESGGVAHFVPDYQALVSQGTEGYRRKVAERRARLPAGSAEADLLRAIEVACDGLESFADGYRREALALAGGERDPRRREELQRIADNCAQVPRGPAATFHQALQSILFAQIALNLESLDEGVSPGRLDQILWPLYQREVAAGELDPARALELLGCFAVKLCEIVPAFSRRTTRFHGGLFNGQVVVVGGMDRQGHDAVNDLTFLFLELMDRLRTRQPNYHARLHRGSPWAYRERIAAALAAGATSPAVYNDEVIVPLLQGRGMEEEDARDYATVGCVEPVAAGRSFLSTDAALFNVTLCLELALNGGRRFGKRRRSGADTPPAERCASAAELFDLFQKQLHFGVDRLLRDLYTIEEGNTRFHPTPLTSMLLEGCLDTLRDASAGGARYNGSGVQGVGVVEVADSLTAVETVVFDQHAASLAEVVEACRTGFRDADALRARLRRAPKYGNDHAAADGWVGRVMDAFASAFAGRRNTRGGAYVAGFYSVTAHQAFGEVVGALPSGRLAGEPFSSGISPSNGLDRLGPTATLCSAGGLPLARAENGVNHNLKLPPWLVSGPEGVKRLAHLVDGAFLAGCMQLQVNVLDPQILIEARDHPGRYPGLLVRVSGYSAYFDDLSPEMKQEIIDRTLCEARES